MKKILAALFIVTALCSSAIAAEPLNAQECCIKQILEQNISYSTRGFFNAIQDGNTELVKLFLKSGMSPNSTYFKVPAIYMAIYSQQNEVVEILLKNGVKPNGEFTTGETPLLVAIKKKDPVIVNTLIKYGADVNMPGTNGNLYPLNYAIKKNNAAIVTSLIEAGAVTNEDALLKALRSKDNNIKNLVLRKYKTQK